jgi:hypothetical protein
MRSSVGVSCSLKGLGTLQQTVSKETKLGPTCIGLCVTNYPFRLPSNKSREWEQEKAGETEGLLYNAKRGSNIM